jgi:hypothetical protein
LAESDFVAAKAAAQVERNAAVATRLSTIELRIKRITVLVTYAISVTSGERYRGGLTLESHFGVLVAFFAIGSNQIDSDPPLEPIKDWLQEGIEGLTGNRRTLLLSLRLPDGMLTLASSRSA